MSHPSLYREAKEAATLILLRQGQTALEILMVKRHPHNAFVPDCYVFPGGAVDGSDLDPGMEAICLGINRRSAYHLMKDTSSPEMALATWIACIRETFEETGILLACSPSGQMIAANFEAENETLNHYRALLRNGQISFKGLLKKKGLLFATDRIHYFSHWITPIGCPIRYDVRFFIAEAPAGQPALHDDHELTDHTWISPDKALTFYEQGRFDMVLPTIMTLRELQRFTAVEQALAFAAEKQMPAILTKLKIKNGNYVEVMPDDAHDDMDS